MSAVQRKASPDMLALIRELCAIRTAVVADGNEALFARIGREVPLKISRYRSGDEFNGWVVPENWRVKRAKIFRDGNEIFDATANSLGVGYYSRQFTGELDWAELAPKLVTNPDLPDAYMFHCKWQYRPWDADSSSIARWRLWHGSAAAACVA